MSPDNVADMKKKGATEIEKASNIQGCGADKDVWSDDERKAGTESESERIGGQDGA